MAGLLTEFVEQASSSMPTNVKIHGGIPTAALAALATWQQSQQRQKQKHDINTTTNMATNKTTNTEGE
jgi:hypothetical protein